MQFFDLVPPTLQFKKVKLYSIYGQVIDVYNVNIVLIGYVRPEWVTVTKWNYYFWSGAALTSTVHKIGLQTFRDTFYARRWRAIDCRYGPRSNSDVCERYRLWFD